MKKSSPQKRANKNLIQMLIIMTVCVALVIANIFYVMISKHHIWSGHYVLDSSVRSSIVTTTLEGKRGTIYDRNREVIAEETAAYTLAAVIDTRTEEEKAEDEASTLKTRENLLKQAEADGNYEQVLAKLEKQDADYVEPYVQDPAALASAVANVVGYPADAASIESIINAAITYNQEQEAAGSSLRRSQVELGSGTKRVDKSAKEALEAMKIPGLSFIETTKRTYEETPFSSNLIGFAAYDEDSDAIKGVMGLESTMNDVLAGQNGSMQYQQTKNGSILPGTTTTLEQPSNGQSVVLTIDKTLQETVEEQMRITMDTNNAEAAWCLVMEVETGKILAWASYPTFDQNSHLEIPSYLDNVAERPFEPGSVMKPFVYATAFDTGVYPYNTYYRAGEFVYYVDENGNIIRLPNGSSSDYPTINDALGTDYGTLTFADGLAHSSNVAICELLANYINYEDFRKYLDAFGFGKLTDIDYVSESAGTINIDEVPSYLSTGFGQASSVTVLELAQAYTALFNDGVMMKPYVVDSIIDATTGEVIEKYEPTVAGTPISSNSASQVKDILRTVLDEGMSGERFAMEGVDMVAKTGTGEIYRTETGSYDKSVYTSSIMAAAPYDDPKILVYWGMESANYLNYSADPFKQIMQAALIADNINGGSSSSSTTEYSQWESYEMPSLVNHSTAYAQNKMDGKKVNTVIVGDGSSIIDQFPKAGTTINSNDNVILVTDGASITMPDLIGWTLKDLTAFWQLTGISIQTDGYGKVIWQSVEAGTPIQSDTQISVSLE